MWLLFEFYLSTDIDNITIVCFNSIDLAGIFEPMETPAATWISAVLDLV